ncbi:MAG: PD-(D/E)XK nuclease family protein [Tannerella sp.]|jgi:hypothetical protein|nr:PD-(D/E)XK nuclease family protein [Tannerella sp.]
MSGIYKNYTNEQTGELLSNYLIEYWSYSRVTSFARNEKSFEKTYLYGIKDKSSASSIAGQAYHAALDAYFKNRQENIPTDIADMQAVAFNHIDGVPADAWKIQKTTPTVADCIRKATKDATALISNFMTEVDIYLSGIKEVISSETRLETWVTVNGVDIPLPLVLVIDLIAVTNDGKRVIIDHKSRTRLTDESELRFTASKQAITYVLGYESETGETIDEVWFIENKISKNKDGSPQLSCLKIIMDKDTRRLYEAILYEPLRRMIQATSDPDYVYIINDSDNFTDRAELYDFWAKTMIAEVEDFDIPEAKRPVIRQRLKKIRDASLATLSPNAIRNFKKYTEQFIPYDLTNKDMTNEEKIEHILRSFGIITKVQYAFKGYSSTTCLLEISAGTPIASVGRYRLDIANALNRPNVRIQKDLFVYEGKSYLAIETGKKSTEALAWDKSKLQAHRIPLGMDNFRQTVHWDLDNQSTPHMLVCGATGSGKSVCIRSVIEYALLGGIGEIYIFDPKYEFRQYASRTGITVINEIEDIELQMGLLALDMESRVKSGKSNKTLVIFDEFADAVANSRKGAELKIYSKVVTGLYKNGAPKIKRECTGEEKSLEENMRILLQKGRSSGYRILAATQRASVKVITGDAKVNFPVQVCFRVPREIDSIVVLDEPGAEALNGRGDGLIKSPEYSGTVRFQAFYVA